MAGRVAWVTGAGGGMGARHAERLAACGARAACLDIDGAAAERVAAGIRAGGGAAAAATVDVGDWEATEAAAEAMQGELGPVGIVVANAGVLGPVAAVAELAPADWSQVLTVNLTGVFHTAKAAIPQMRSHGGAMVLVSSISGLRGYAGAAPTTPPSTA